MRDDKVKQKRLETIYAKYGNMSGGFAKLNDTAVTDIIKLINTGGSNPEIAKKYDCHISTVRAIRMKESWKHLSHLLTDARTPKERKKQQVETLYNQGIDRVTIWTSTGIPRSTVISWIAEIEKRNKNNMIPS
jgi:DNA invertase Pin-like site-specific DNA recombinase